MPGIGSYLTGTGGSLPLQEGQRTTTRQEEEQGQEEQEEIKKDIKRTINYLNKKIEKNVEKCCLEWHLYSTGVYVLYFLFILYYSVIQILKVKKK